MKALKISTLFAALVLATAAQAGGSATATIAQLYSYGSISFYFPTGGMSGQPGCASSAPNRLAIDTSTANGASFARSLAQAMVLGQVVTFTGSGYCTIAGGVEDLQIISITP